MAKIIDLDSYRRVKAGDNNPANDNGTSRKDAHYWTSDHYEISVEILNGTVVAKEHPNPRAT